MKNQKFNYLLLLLLLLAPGAWALPPTAVDDDPLGLPIVTIPEDTVAIADVLANDTDPEGDPLFVAGFNPGPTSGALPPVPIFGPVTYTPIPGFSGMDTFSYQAGDCAVPVPCIPLSNLAVVTIHVSAVADAPSLTASDVSGNEDTPVPLSISASLDTIGDPDGSETLLVEISGVTGGASLSVGNPLGGGVWELTPAQLGGVAVTEIGRVVAAADDGAAPCVLIKTGDEIVDGDELGWQHES